MVIEQLHYNGYTVIINEYGISMLTSGGYYIFAVSNKPSCLSLRYETTMDAIQAKLPCPLNKLNETNWMRITECTYEKDVTKPRISKMDVDGLYGRGFSNIWVPDPTPLVLPTAATVYQRLLPCTIDKLGSEYKERYDNYKACGWLIERKFE